MLYGDKERFVIKGRTEEFSPFPGICDSLLTYYAKIRERNKHEMQNFYTCVLLRIERERGWGDWRTGRQLHVTNNYIDIYFNHCLPAVLFLMREVPTSKFVKNSTIMTFPWFLSVLPARITIKYLELGYDRFLPHHLELVTG